MRLKVTVDGVAYDVEVEVEEEPRPPLGAIFMGGGFVPQHAVTPAAAPPSSDGAGVKAPLAGSVARVLVKEGQEIAAGDVLVILEAMKMETEITAPAAGTVQAVLVAPGDSVGGGQVLVELSAAE
ncbi:MAG TPA: biotin/lipoyl-binding protein [Nocardioides sp.]|uniref:biotin/lipoyl-containing protein n=1 Tax=Nocardioides sp. TaxID=35761 RepID=UPI002C7EF3B8|nr:biotin/lipoyl-containing protein [Nocardioides sp.]HQR27596.1 biotin/lipoyl-binding protein [Nocardioides sp.]